ncbi:MAG: S9 family peptidase [Gemmatimonadota bacterium]
MTFPGSPLRIVVVYVSLVLSSVLWPAASVAAQDNGIRGQERLQLEMFLELESVSDPQLSPDGFQILFNRGWIDPVNDSRESAIWIMDADGSRARFLVDGSSASWSPDGTRIAYLASGEPRGSQIFVRWMDAEGAVSQITRVENSPSNVRWSPDGENLAFTMDVDSEPDFRISLPSRPQGAEWVEDPKVVTRLNFRRDRVGYSDGGYAHLFTVPAGGGAPRQVTQGDWDHSAPEWMPDGQELVFSSLRVDSAEYRWRQSEIYAVNVRSRAVREFTSRRGLASGPVPSPDGRHVAFVGGEWHDDTYRDREVWLVDRTGANLRMISSGLQRSAGSLMWAQDGSGVYFDVDADGTRNLWFASVSGGARRITEGNHMLSTSSVDGGGQAVGVRTTSHDPGQVVTFALNRPSEIRSLTRMNESLLSEVELGEVEQLWYNSQDDYRIQGWLIKPPDFDPSQRYPLILAIHGGPHGMYNVGFNFSWQEHAAQGYLVLYTNPRGSSGYGSAFGNAIKNAYPGDDLHDLLNGVDEVVDRGIVDEENMFVYGCSGGGVLTAWVIAHTDRFAAASVNCPVINWLSFVGTTDGSGWYRNFQSFPWDDPTEHLERSPLMYVGNVSTPTMLMTGEKDLRTPMGQTEEYYQALRVLGVPAMMVRFPDEWHGTSSVPSNFLRSQLYLQGWFQKWSRSSPALE